MGELAGAEEEGGASACPCAKGHARLRRVGDNELEAELRKRQIKWGRKKDVGKRTLLEDDDDRRKLEGGVSAVTKQITVKDKYQKQLAELDLMAEDWVDTDEVPLSPSPPPFLSHT